MERKIVRLSEPQISVCRTVDDMRPAERHVYSYSRLLRYALKPDPTQECLESDVSRSMQKEFGITPEIGGLWAPLSLRTGLDTKSGGAGGYLTGTDTSADIITLLRQKLVLASLGASFISLPRTTSMPVQLGGSTAQWVGENPGSDITDSDSSFGARTLVPHSLLISTSFSKKLLEQTGGSTEQFVRGDLARAIASALDVAGIQGSGLSNEPVGLVNTANIPIEAGGSNGAIPNWNNCLNLELKVSQNHADLGGSLGYLSTPELRCKMKQIVQVSGSSRMLWEGNQVNGYPAQASAIVPKTLTKGSAIGTAHALCFGDWSQLLVANFGVMAILVDQFAKKKQGQVEVSLYVDCDCLIRRTESFCLMLDALVS